MQKQSEPLRLQQAAKLEQSAASDSLYNFVVDDKFGF